MNGAVLSHNSREEKGEENNNLKRLHISQAKNAMHEGIMNKSIIHSMACLHCVNFTFVGKYDSLMQQYSNSSPYISVSNNPECVKQF
jgi:hypothetical protein